MVEWLNYHHLYYFWVVAKEGGITSAAERLLLAQPTLSSQVQKLEKTMGLKLFERVGRGMVLTDTGQLVYRYADEIFGLGRELTDAIQGKTASGGLRLVVGVPDVIPKMMVFQLLKPALTLSQPMRLVCYEGKLHDLLDDLALHRLDLVLANTPLMPHMNVRAFNHLVDECTVSILATEELAKVYSDDFPNSLHGAPMLLPTQNTSMRRTLEQWFADKKICPVPRHEFEDSAVLKVFAQSGEGLFAAPTAIARQACDQYGFHIVGEIKELTERYYAISVERRFEHAGVTAIINRRIDTEKGAGAN